MAIRKRQWKAGSETREAWIADYRDGSGARRQKTFKRKRDAEEWLQNAGVEIRAGIHVPDSKSVYVRDALDKWIEECGRGRDGGEPLEWSTIKQYKGHAKHIEAMIGGSRLSEFDKPRLAQFRDDLIDRVSRATARKILNSFKMMMVAGGASPGVIHHARELKISIDTRTKKQIQVPERAQVAAILKAVDRLADTGKSNWQRWRGLVHIAVLTGMRASEIRGLVWGNLDFDAGIIKVRQRADQRGMIGPVKSKAGEREIPMPDQLITLVRQWYLISGRPEADSIVFPSPKGRPIAHSNLHHLAWEPLLKKAEVPYFNFHLLRHFHASQLIANGANPKEIQVELGHSSIQFTFDRYGHLFEDDFTKRRDRANRLAAEIR